MTLEFRHLRLRAVTGQGRFGVDVPMSPGLMIFRADNSRGKSTTIQSVLFALGLERMISSRPSDILPAAMRDRLIYDPDTMDETPVLEAWVTLEMRGAQGQVATVTRWVKHPSLAQNLVRVTSGPSLTVGGDHPTEDFYTGRSGSAANPRGFQHWLARFMGWEMPELPTSDGRMAPLYLEQVFPLVFVEQRRGWAGIQAQMPFFSGVPDVRRRAIEFLMDFEVGRIESERRRLKARESELQVSWRTAVRSFKETLAGSGIVSQHLPEALTVSWPPPTPSALIESSAADWLPLDDVVAGIQAELGRMDSADVPSVGETSPDSERRLAKALNELDELGQQAGLIRDDMLRDRQEVESIKARLSALDEDLRQHQDLVILQRLGSPDLDRMQHDCPVCHQTLPDSLIAAGGVTALGPEESVAYIQNQVDLFRVMERDSRRSLSAKRERIAGAQQQALKLRQEIRALRSSLTAPNAAPTAAIIARRLNLEQRLTALRSIIERFHQLMGELGRIAEFAAAVQATLRDLPVDGLSGSDRDKLERLRTSFVDQLHQYHFGSFSDAALQISPIDYLPRRDDFDLQADISASDSIRVIWAYLVGLLEVAKSVETNHPGVLVFDEPRQQSTNPVSFAALLARASSAATGGRQIIFATSEELDSLREMLADVKHTLYSVEGYVLKPVAE